MPSKAKPEKLEKAINKYLHGEEIAAQFRKAGAFSNKHTLNLYSHVIQSADARAAKTLENLLDPLRNKR